MEKKKKQIRRERINQLKSILIFVFKATVSIGSLYIVSRTIAWSEVGDVLTHAQYSLIVLALVIFWVAQIFSSLRCLYVSRVLGGKLDFATSLRAHLVGLWFNQVMPTSLGGDVIKMALLKKPLGLGLAIRSAILDRLSGFMFLLLITAITLPLYDNIFPSHIELVIALGFISVAGWLTIILGAWAAHRMSKFPISNQFSIIFIKIFSDVWAFKKGIHLWEQAWTSAIVHFNGVFTFALLGFALGIDISWVTLILVVPLVFLIALIPVSFAGWGLRESGSVWLFGMVGISSEQALALSVSFGLLLVLAGLPGLFLFIRNRSLGNTK